MYVIKSDVLSVRLPTIGMSSVNLQPPENSFEELTKCNEKYPGTLSYGKVAGGKKEVWVAK